MGRLVPAACMLTSLCLFAGCRFLLGPDDARPPPVDTDGNGVLDGSEDGADAEPGLPQVCDLFLQDCPNKQGCYPDEKLAGGTQCVFGGSGSPLAGCSFQSDCAPRLICITADPSEAGSCVDLCHPAAAVTGCQVGMLCVPLRGYLLAGYCRF